MKLKQNKICVPIFEKCKVFLFQIVFGPKSCCSVSHVAENKRWKVDKNMEFQKRLKSSSI